MSTSLDRFLSTHPGRDLDLEGLRLHYLDEGEGDPVVMVHGNPSWSFYYRNLVETLSGSNRVIVPDHIGCGMSEKPGDDRYEYTLSRRIDDLERLLDHLKVDAEVTLVVHDWGGMIGMGYATRHPGRIARIVVLNTGAFRLPKEKPMPWQLTLARSPLGAMLVRGFNAFAKGTTRIGCTKRPMTRDVAEAYVAPYDSWANRVAVHRFVQDIPLKPGDRAWDSVVEAETRLPLLRGVPMMVAWGMKDIVFDRHFLAEWERRFPDAEVHRFEEAGHYILEDEAEAVTSLVQAFLASHPIAREVG